MDEQYMTISQAIAYLGLTDGAIYKAIRNRRITGKKVGRVWYLEKESVKLYRRKK